MLIWLDTINEDAIKEAIELGLLFGVTTNPIILASSQKPLRETLQGLLDIQDGPLAVQVLSEDSYDMLEEGKDLFTFSDRIIVKTPVSKEGLKAIYLLSQEGIPTMATTVFTPSQAFMASMAGANFIAPYFSHIEKSGRNALQTLRSMVHILNVNQLTTEVIAASINSIEQFEQCAEIPVPHITIKDSLFKQLIDTSPMTSEWVEKFRKAASKADLKL